MSRWCRPVGCINILAKVLGGYLIYIIGIREVKWKYEYEYEKEFGLCLSLKCVHAISTCLWMGLMQVDSGNVLESRTWIR